MHNLCSKSCRIYFNALHVRSILQRLKQVIGETCNLSNIGAEQIVCAQLASAHTLTTYRGNNHYITMFRYTFYDNRRLFNTMLTLNDKIK